MPTTKLADAARDATSQLTSALLNPHPAAPFALMAGGGISALRKLAEIFARTTGATKANEEETCANPGVSVQARQPMHPAVTL